MTVYKPIQTFRKDPDAVLDYSFDWSEYLEAGDSAETIATSTFTVDTGLTKDSDSKDDTTTTVWLSGGTAGETYEVRNEIVTGDGRTDVRTIKIAVEVR